MGKTHKFGVLLEADYRVAILAIEARIEGIRANQPLVITVDTPKDATDLCSIFQDPKKRKAFMKEHTNGRWDDADVLGCDSLMEFESMLDTAMRAKYPSKKDDGYARWDEYGTDFINFCRQLRDVATEVSPEPIPVIATMGIAWETSKQGIERRVRLVKGRQAPPRIPFYFSNVYRLESDIPEGANKSIFRMQIAGEGIKPIGTILEDTYKSPYIDITGSKPFLKIWKAHEIRYREGEQAARDYLAKKGL